MTNPKKTSAWEPMKMGVQCCNIAVLDYYFTWILRVFIFCHAVIVVLWEVVSCLFQETLRFKEWGSPKGQVVCSSKVLVAFWAWNQISNQSFFKRTKVQVLAYKRLKPVHFLLWTDIVISYYMQNYWNLYLEFSQKQVSGPINDRDFQETGPRLVHGHGATGE